VSHFDFFFLHPISPQLLGAHRFFFSAQKSLRAPFFIRHGLSFFALRANTFSHPRSSTSSLFSYSQEIVPPFQYSSSKPWYPLIFPTERSSRQRHFCSFLSLVFLSPDLLFSPSQPPFFGALPITFKRLGFPFFPPPRVLPRIFPPRFPLPPYVQRKKPAVPSF